MSGRDNFGQYYGEEGEGREGERGLGDSARGFLSDGLKKFKQQYSSSSSSQQGAYSQQQQQSGSGTGQPPPYQGASGPPSSYQQQQPYQDPSYQSRPHKQDKLSGFLDKFQEKFSDVGAQLAETLGTTLDADSYAQYGSKTTDNRFKSFAPVRENNEVKWHVDGYSYFWAVSLALESAKESIWILDWWLSPELYLRRPPAKNEQYRVDRMLQAAAQRGVRVNIIVYKEVEQALTLSSEHTKRELEALHPNILVFRHPDHIPDTNDIKNDLAASLQNLSLDATSLSKLPEDTVKGLYGRKDDTVLFWAHHEKLCLIDGKIAFMGGLDLCFGRWDTNQHAIADVHPGDLREIVFPGQDYNNARVLDFQNVSHWEQNQLDRKVTSRMGWSDISISLRGPVVEDLRRHFVDRWNYIYDTKYSGRNEPKYQRLSLYRQTSGHGSQQQASAPAPGGPPAPSTSTAQPPSQQPPNQGHLSQEPHWQQQQLAGQSTYSPGPGTQGQQSSVGQSSYPPPPGGALPGSQGQQQSQYSQQQSHYTQQQPQWQGQQQSAAQSSYPPSAGSPLPGSQGQQQSQYSQQQPSEYSQQQGQPNPAGQPYYSPTTGQHQQQQQQPQYSQPQSPWQGQQQQQQPAGPNQFNPASANQPSGQYFPPPPPGPPLSHSGGQDPAHLGYGSGHASSQTQTPTQSPYFPPPPGQEPQQSQTREVYGSEDLSRGYGGNQPGYSTDRSTTQNIMTDVRGFGHSLRGQLAGQIHQYQDRYITNVGRPIGNQWCQVVRSCSKWSAGIPTEHSVQDAYIAAIRNSQHFVYIENQFFITATGDEQKPVQNKIGAAIVERILRAAKAGEKYKIIVLIPAVPGFAGDLRDDSSLGTRAIMEYQYNSINRGGHSIMELIAKEGYNPMEYIRFYNLRNYDRINTNSTMLQAERASGVNYEEARKYHDAAEVGYGGYGPGAPAPRGYDTSQPYDQYQKAATAHPSATSGRWDSVSECYMLGGQDIRTVPWDSDLPEIDAFVSEELYIHTKVLIADDRIVICGSANLNDRSQLGTHDSEIALVIEDPTPLESQMDGKPWRASRFAASLRRELFRKHLGLLKPQDYTRPTANCEPVGVPNEVDLNSPESQVVADPLSDTFQSLWNSRARTNTEVFRKVFNVVPDDYVRNWEAYKEFYEYNFRKAAVEAEGRRVIRPGRYEWGHVVRDNFAPGPEGVGQVKELLSQVKGNLVEMPLMFLIEEDIAKEGLTLNALTEPIYT